MPHPWSENPGLLLAEALLGETVQELLPAFRSA
jgi:hypothetical protein